LRVLHADLVHHQLALAALAVQGQAVQGGDDAVLAVHLLLVGLLRRAGGVAGAVSAGQGGGLGRGVGAGVVGVLPVGLGILAVERVGRIVVGKFLLVHGLIQQAVDLPLVLALIAGGAAALPLLQGAGRLVHRLARPVLGRGQRLLHRRLVVQALGAVGVLFLGRHGWRLLSVTVLRACFSALPPGS